MFLKSRLRVLSATGLAVLMALGMLGSTANAETAEKPTAAPVDLFASSTVGFLVNVNSGRCLAIPNGDPGNGVQARTDDCQNQENRHWELGQSEPGVVMIRNKKTMKCLAIPQSNPADGVPVIQHDCMGEWPDQHWQRVPVGDGWAFSNTVTRKCITVRDASQSSGAPIIQETCAFAPHQVWRGYAPGQVTAP
ncbi:RICIN domain-containing protein [Crossiella sp. SN42]|uniref:RICIN domain-containing protein n=1 Tax=Crossiella sp. SN42 TaxID=2944808 RepID=UPI00207C71F3|nr:RICIN domain-containing protein [Crossiella sp. SN42]MCO1575902.1 RICIN domain-containing protein [Crossiella sp. SN42]